MGDSPAESLTGSSLAVPSSKRTFDVLVAGAVLVVLSPVLLLLALLVRLTSGSPVIFGHSRCGRGGRSFDCLKFRTMVNGAHQRLDEDEELRAHYIRNGYKLPRARDERVTPVGHVLRYTHLDELPQLVNVLRGDMSLVGPRPIIQEELEEYGDRSDLLLSVQPGIFGAWTAMGKDRPTYPERVDVELSYVGDTRPFKDLRVLAANVPVLIWGQTDE